MIQISNTEIHGLNRSLHASGLPMRREKLVDLFDNSPSIESLERGQRLSKNPSGSGHPNYLNGIKVWFNLKYNMTFLKQIDRYHWIDYTSSQSTMYTLTKMSKTDLVEACDPLTSPVIIQEVWNLIEDYQKEKSSELFHRIVYSLPCGFHQWVEASTNYLQLKTIYHQRRGHKLKDWQIFCNWIETLPHAWGLIIGQEAPIEKQGEL